MLVITLKVKMLARAYSYPDAAGLDGRVTRPQTCNIGITVHGSLFNNNHIKAFEFSKNQQNLQLRVLNHNESMKSRTKKDRYSHFSTNSIKPLNSHPDTGWLNFLCWSYHHTDPSFCTRLYNIPPGRVFLVIEWLLKGNKCATVRLSSDIPSLFSKVADRFGIIG